MILVSTCTRLPPHPVALHHSPAVRSGPATGQRAAEAPERHLVLGAQHQQPARLCARTATGSQRRSPTAERSSANGSGSTCVRRAVDPHGPLRASARRRARRRPGSTPPARPTRRPRRPPTSARRSPARGSRRCRRRSRGPRTAARARVPRTGTPRLLARPDVLRAVRRDDLDALALLERQVEPGAAHAPGRHPHRAGRAGASARADARRPIPPTTTTGTPPIEARAAHAIAVRSEGADPAPALQRAAAAHQRHPRRREREVRRTAGDPATRPLPPAPSGHPRTISSRQRVD